MGLRTLTLPLAAVAGAILMVLWGPVPGLVIVLTMGAVMALLLAALQVDTDELP
jgi:hypothetical protein